MDAGSYEKVVVKIVASDPVCNGSRTQSHKLMLLSFLLSSMVVLAS